MPNTVFYVCRLDGTVERRSAVLRLSADDEARIARAIASTERTTELHIGIARIEKLPPDAALVMISPHPVNLTPRQREVALYAAHGATAKEIASHLALSPYTVKQHLKAVYRQLDVASRLELRQVLGPAAS